MLQFVRVQVGEDEEAGVALVAGDDTIMRMSCRRDQVTVGGHDLQIAPGSPARSRVLASMSVNRKITVPAGAVILQRIVVRHGPAGQRDERSLGEAATPLGAPSVTLDAGLSTAATRRRAD